MIQRNLSADFGALTLNHPVEGLAMVVRVVRVSSDNEHKLHVLVSNASGEQWVWIAPSITAHATLQTTDAIYARFTVRQGARKTGTWATGLRICNTDTVDANAKPEPDPLTALARASRTNCRVLIHGLALAALASDFVREGSHFETRHVKEQLFKSIHGLPASEARLLIATAQALDL